MGYLFYSLVCTVTGLNEFVVICDRLWQRVDFSYQEIHGSCVHIWRGTTGEVNADPSMHSYVLMPCNLHCCSVRLFTKNLIIFSYASQTASFPGQPG